jgi:hypothetical protein
MPNFRAHILLVLGTIPAVFDLPGTNQVILSITGYPPDYDPFKGREKVYKGMLATIQSHRENLAR